MVTKIEVTNKDVLQFYADKFADEEHCPITAKYLSKLKAEESKKKKGEKLKGESLHDARGYVQTINTFKKVETTDEKDEEFYEWLQNREIVSFSFFLPDVFLKHTDYYDVALQKWHLYVCWYAYRESGIRSRKKLDNEQLDVSAEKPNGILQYMIKCRELFLWMCEAAGSMQTDSLYEKMILIEEGKVEVEDWAKEVKEEIKRIIWENKEKPQIISKSLLSACANQYYLKLDRTTQSLEVYEQVDNNLLRELYPLREDFDTSDYVLFTLKKSIPCIFGGKGRTRTPAGIFRIEHVSGLHEEYVSPYHPQHDQVKFFGYLAVFEDYFIHSNMYLTDATSDNFHEKEPVSEQDAHTSGCIRVPQEELDWLVEHIPEGTTIAM